MRFRVELTRPIADGALLEWRFGAPSRQVARFDASESCVVLRDPTPWWRVAIGDAMTG